MGPAGSTGFGVPGGGGGFGRRGLDRLHACYDAAYGAAGRPDGGVLCRGKP